MGEPNSPQVIGRYAIYGKIASGGMASVHFGRLIGAAGFSRTVAIKRLHPHLAEDPEFFSTLIDEARLAARIRHPNVVPTLDVVATQGELLVVMEYVRGESLSRLLRAEALSGTRTPLPIASAIAMGALHGLHAAHEATSDLGVPLGIVHRDVSPQNILVDVDGVARVIDFGIAKAAGRLQTTREGVIKGKVGYMAPEQMAAGEVTRSADVYSMSVILWEMLAGQRLFQGDNDAVLMAQVVAGVTKPPSRYSPEVTPELDALVMKGLSRRPEDRFASAREMAELLVRIVPPGISTYVGAWCERAARESLATHGALLAEIESSSGAANSPSAIHPDDDAPMVASQPSSLSVEAPRWRFSSRPPSPRRRLRGAAYAGIALALCLGAVWWNSGRTPTTHAIDARAVPSTAAPPAEPSVPPPVRPDPPPPTPPISATPPALDSKPSPSHPTTRRPAAPATPPAKPKLACDPPYVINAAGDRKYLPECL
jgi:eukaryotic-like serine/threonine-protein kinase